ncbi:extracellular solute-binding protein, family 3 [Magnetococcus marinus MC-1]|uniref:Extracellular solute-binding protein, family 3 n=1 Tax=Magnetococcus marinus (strain ATCC BAA-1437 / JCM 17883 / MC-1) TaxID=156889 RepID=A0L494_MAGMM|nr:ABC transporter substrate-binding protein [Magnetococcus marinus]ABK42787.1 extracellular solute-binding protein, family 3 [Magnetococcus marinus MC-1]
MERRLLRVALVLVAVVTGSVYYTYHKTPGALDPVGTLSIAASKTLSPTLVWLAHDKGFFQKAGLEVTLIPAATGKVAGESLLNGQADLAAATEFLALRMVNTQADLRVLGTLAFVHQMKLIALKEKGIRSAVDLKGKKIGVRLGTNGEYFLERLLALNGLDQQAIQRVDLKPQEMAARLAQGEVDGVMIWPPLVQQIEGQLGDRVVSFDGQPEQDYYYVLMGLESWLQKNPLKAERVMLALTQAEAWFKANPQEGVAYMAGLFALPPALLEKALADYHLAVTLPQSLLTMLEAEARWLSSVGLSRRMDNYLQIMSPGPLKKVAPSMVTITP